MLQKWIVITAVGLVLTAGALFAERPAKTAHLKAEQSEREEMHPKNLPTACRMYIMQNYSGAEILKAFKLNGSEAAYAVKLNYEGQQLELLFDSKGNFLKRA